MMGGTVLVTLFENLTDEEALLIGVSHNQQDEEAKFMSFIDKVLIIKTIKTISKQWSSSAMKIFGFKVNHSICMYE
ncbi:hypothetical protein DPMN_182890 [Dreissena polymorpha]|uniref:Uncharacterized protein n=1 Tax=Dreissena polymorpha TaxID=45954 RepID=A0A9D4DIZ3_DREPO|nr:hypothetical protein DPMN_182890 [Dreissena polymorpha]